MREDIKEVDKAVADKTISLNEEQRLKEKDEADARRQAREAELKTRKIPPDGGGSSIALKNGDVVVEALGKTNSTLLAKSKNAPAVGQGGTNSAMVASADAATKDKTTNVEDDSDPEKTPAVDVELLEARTNSHRLRFPHYCPKNPR